MTTDIQLVEGGLTFFLVHSCTFFYLISLSFVSSYHFKWRGQNAENVTHIRGRLLDQAVFFFQLRPFSKWELLLKERSCSQTERVLSFQGSSLCYGKSLLQH